MEKEFIPYEEALALKELGFDEGSYAWYYEHNKEFGMSTSIIKCDGKDISAPLYQQAFRWFRDNHNLTHMVSDNLEAFVFAVEGALMFAKIYESYEEAELACLQKLILSVHENNHKNMVEG